VYISRKERSLMVAERITFLNRDATAFVEEMKQKVADFFQTRGISQNANFAMVSKTVIILTVTFGTYAMLLSNYFSLWVMLGFAVVMGFCYAGIGFSIAHDALHGAYSANPVINRILGFTFELCGANGYMWKLTHNVIHHTYTNIPGVDEDLTVSPLLRLSPQTEHKPIHRFQHLYALLAYGFATIFWIFVKDYKYILQKDIGPYKDKRHPASEWVILIVGKLLYYLVFIIIPFFVLNVTWWQFLIGFFVMHLTAGAILGVIFQLAHVVEGIDYPMPDKEGNMEHGWMVHEMETTSDFARNNKLLSWYIGGLNFQIEHHLFPKVCSIHYPEISRIVQETAEKHHVRYNHHETLSDAIRSHYAMLRKYGRG
jgi:linoleoyl-CoA desaturase